MKDNTKAQNLMNFCGKNIYDSTATCPHCRAKIDSLDYQNENVEYGSAALDGEFLKDYDHDCIKCTYSCPECGGVLNPVDRD